MFFSLNWTKTSCSFGSGPLNVSQQIGSLAVVERHEKSKSTVELYLLCFYVYSPMLCQVCMSTDDDNLWAVQQNEGKHSDCCRYLMSSASSSRSVEAEVNFPPTFLPTAAAPSLGSSLLLAELLCVHAHVWVTVNEFVCVGSFASSTLSRKWGVQRRNKMKRCFVHNWMSWFGSQIEIMHTCILHTVQRFFKYKI